MSEKLEIKEKFTVVTGTYKEHRFKYSIDITFLKCVYNLKIKETNILVRNVKKQRCRIRE